MNNKFILSNQLDFAVENLDIADNSLRNIIRDGDIALNGDFERAEENMRVIDEKLNNIKSNLSALKELNKNRIKLLDKQNKIINDLSIKQ